MYYLQIRTIGTQEIKNNIITPACLFGTIFSLYMVHSCYISSVDDLIPNIAG